MNLIGGEMAEWNPTLLLNLNKYFFTTRFLWAKKKKKKDSSARAVQFFL